MKSTTLMPCQETTIAPPGPYIHSSIPYLAPRSIHTLAPGKIHLYIRYECSRCLCIADKRSHENRPLSHCDWIYVLNSVL